MMFLDQVVAFGRFWGNVSPDFFMHLILSKCETAICLSALRMGGGTLSSK